MTSVHFSSRTDEWATPRDLFDKLDREFNFRLDVCANADNAKCQEFFTREQDGLSIDWVEHIWSKPEVFVPGAIWMNPPYGREIGKWVAKACRESSQSYAPTIVCLLPARTDTKWFHDYLYGDPTIELRFIKGRLKFGDSKNSAPFPSMIAIIRPIKD